MSHRRHLVSLAFAAAVLALAPGRAEAQDRPLPLELRVVQGTWGWISNEDFTCARNPHTIDVSDDGRAMRFTYPSPTDSTGRREFIYDIGAVEEGVVRVALRGEERRDEAGKLVEWDLVLLSLDRYAWRRSDWPEDSGTGSIERCSRPKVEAPAAKAGR